MSYNISAWKTKQLKDLVIPFESFAELGSDRIETIIEGAKTTVIIYLSEDAGITGILSDENRNILVGEINLYGEFSGHDYGDFLLPALKTSTGILEAVLVWEGGDSITRLIVNDGEVTEQDVEL